MEKSGVCTGANYPNNEGVHRASETWRAVWFGAINDRKVKQYKMTKGNRELHPFKF